MFIAPKAPLEGSCRRRRLRGERLDVHSKIDGFHPSEPPVRRPTSPQRGGFGVYDKLKFEYHLSLTF